MSPPLDKEAMEAMQTAAPLIRNSLHEHYEIFERTGIIALCAGFVGGTVAFFLGGQQKAVVMTRKGILIYYISKVAMGFFAAYLAVLAIPILGLTVWPETEQVVSVLAAILGSDFIAFLIRRIFGEHFQMRKVDRRNTNTKEEGNEVNNV